MRLLNEKFHGDVVFLKDSELKTPAKLQSEQHEASPAKVLFQPLPCVESYYLLDAFLNGSFKTKEVKTFLQLCSSAVEFHSGFNENLKKNPAEKKNAVPNPDLDPKQLLKQKELIWNTALGELEKEQPNWINVVKVIRGHSGVSYFFKTDTCTLIKEKELSHPSTLELIKDIHKLLVSALGLNDISSISSHLDDKK
jgi:hypothetical protein